MERKKITGIVIVVIIVITGGLFAGDMLPSVGDASSPVNSHVSPYYIQNSLEDTGAHSMVTAVLADYRSFVSIFEIGIMFLSGITSLMILSSPKKQDGKLCPYKNAKRQDRAVTADDKKDRGTVIDAAFRIVVPIIVLYAFYVLAHGEVSLGGGFQTGGLLAIAYMLDRLVPGTDRGIGKLSGAGAAMLAGSGVLICIATGILPMFNGGKFLEYSCLPFETSDIATLHQMGMFMMEIGVVICVMATIINILEVVLERTEFDD